MVVVVFVLYIYVSVLALSLSLIHTCVIPSTGQVQAHVLPIVHSTVPTPGDTIVARQLPGTLGLVEEQGQAHDMAVVVFFPLESGLHGHDHLRLGLGGGLVVGLWFVVVVVVVVVTPAPLCVCGGGGGEEEEGGHGGRLLERCRGRHWLSCLSGLMMVVWW